MMLDSKRRAINLIVALVVSFLCALFAVQPAIKAIAKKYTASLFANETRFLFQIPSPSGEQISEIRGMTFVNKVNPYYDLFSSVKINNSVVLQNYPVMLIDSEDVDSFPITSEILRIKGGATQNPLAFVDYAFANKFNARIGDTLTIQVREQEISVPVLCILQNCTDYMPNQIGDSGSIILAFTENIFTDIEQHIGRNLSYSGAYLSANSRDFARNYFRTYKPLARLRDNADFRDEAAYRAYLADFYAASYEPEIRDLSLLNLSAENVNPLVNAIITAVLVLLTVVVITLASFSGGRVTAFIEQKIKNGANLKAVGGGIKSEVLVLVILAFAVISGFTVLFIVTQQVYCPFVMYIPFLLACLAGIALSGVFFADIYTKKYITRFLPVMTALTDENKRSK